MTQSVRLTLLLLAGSLLGCGSRDARRQQAARQDTALRSTPTDSPSIINLVAKRDPTATLPSVVVGDFDGDGQSDVAMIGISRDSIAGVMLLTNASDARGPMLLFMNRPRPSGSSRKSYVVLRIADKEMLFKELKLHRDAVEEESVGQGAVVFYVERGVLRQLQTSD